jgi:PAS domain S-box-containing protein
LENIEYIFLTKDGREFPAELSASVLKDSAGSSRGFVAITKDISECKKKEDSIKQYSEQLEKLVEEKTIELINA